MVFNCGDAGADGRWDFQKEQLYEGKAKKVFATDDPDVVIVDYKDDATAFNGEKKGTIVGKGVIKELRKRHPGANIVAIDYDPGASEVNQLNRIKLMLSTAFKNLDKPAERRKEA